MENIKIKSLEGATPPKSFIETAQTSGGISFNKGELGQVIEMTPSLLKPQEDVPQGVPPMWRSIQVLATNKSAGLPAQLPVAFRRYRCTKAGNPQRVNGTLVGDKATYLPIYDEDPLLYGEIPSGTTFRAVTPEGAEISVTVG